MLPIQLLTGSASPADLERCRGFVDFLRRRALLAGEETPEPATSPDRHAVAKALLSLAGRGLLSHEVAADGAVEVFYVPSRQASRDVFESGTETGFAETVQKKQVAAFRSSTGAILHFPLEEGGGDLEVFITDWSPCPAACAVAIHRGHPLTVELEKPDGPWFTGRYVRHPLTGDLLPVWVADWVRPDFGTGAVLVNPAHDRNDLAFGRAIGLPIRFALVPAEYDGSPATWPEPPLVKSGQTVRTGPYDGLPVAEAVERYFQVMAERGLAERYRDLQAGRWKIGRLVPESEGELAWSRSRWTVLPVQAADNVLNARCEPAGLLAAALAIPEGVRPVLVCPAGELAGELLGLRLLWQDLTGQPLAPAAVFLIQKVQESKTEASAEVVRLATLVGAPAQQVAVIKQQVVEQVQRFLRTHQELLAQAAAADGTGGAEAVATPAERAFPKIKAAVGEGDPAKAFSLLQQTQKQMRDLAPGERAAALPGYFVLAEVVAGLERPAGLAAGPVWNRIP